MDSQGFRKAPLDFKQPSPWQVGIESTAERERMVGHAPVEDNRYPAFTGPMSDGRQFTDYRERCVTYAKPEFHNPVRQWMNHNADELISMARRRQAQNTGAVLGTQQTFPEDDIAQTCDEFGCKFTRVSPPGVGLGLRTTNSTCPELFGTFTFPADPELQLANRKHIELTDVAEGGRNVSGRWRNFVK